MFSDLLVRICRAVTSHWRGWTRSRSNATAPRSIFSILFPLHHHQVSNLPQTHLNPSQNGSPPPSKSQIRYSLCCSLLTKVLSGDTIVFVGKPRPDGKPPTERIISLAYVSAPRFKREGDEVFPSLALLNIAICI
jgi:hypothetical protein